MKENNVVLNDDYINVSEEDKTKLKNVESDMMKEAGDKATRERKE